MLKRLKNHYKKSVFASHFATIFDLQTRKILTSFEGKNVFHASFAFFFNKFYDLASSLMLNMTNVIEYLMRMFSVLRQ